MSLTNLPSGRFKLKWFDAFSYELNRKEGSLPTKICSAICSFFCGRTVEKSELEQHHLRFGKKTILGLTITAKKLSPKETLRQQMQTTTQILTRRMSIVHRYHQQRPFKLIHLKSPPLHQLLI